MDIIGLLEANGIPYVTAGPNVGRNEIGIKCPFCGEADPSEHLSWNPNTGYWICRRAPAKHYGRKPHRLIMQLIGCTYEQADQIVSGGRDLGSFKDTIRNLLNKQSDPIQSNLRSLNLPKEFRSLTTKGSGRYFVEYLIQRRRFRPQDIPELTKEYDLRFCTTGRWRNRIIFPIYLDDQLVCWTGRAISQNPKLRYLSLGDSDELEMKALLSPKELVYNFDLLLTGGKVLFLTEGPFDAVKLDLYGKRYGARATCLFGTGITDSQVNQISQLCNRFENLAVLGDTGALANVRFLMGRLARLQPKQAKLPKGVDDPGDLEYNLIKRLLREHL